MLLARCPRPCGNPTLTTGGDRTGHLVVVELIIISLFPNANRFLTSCNQSAPMQLICSIKQWNTPKIAAACLLQLALNLTPKKCVFFCAWCVCDSRREECLFIWNEWGRCYQNKYIIGTAGWLRAVSTVPKLRLRPSLFTRSSELRTTYSRSEPTPTWRSVAGTDVVFFLSLDSSVSGF